MCVTHQINVPEREKSNGVIKTMKIALLVFSVTMFSLISEKVFDHRKVQEVQEYSF